MYLGLTKELPWAKQGRESKHACANARLGRCVEEAERGGHGGDEERKGGR